MRVIDVARGPLIVVAPDAPLHRAAHLMDLHGVDAFRLLRDRTLHRLPVVAGDKLVAMVTLDDFAVGPPAELTRLVRAARPERFSGAGAHGSAGPSSRSSTS